MTAHAVRASDPDAYRAFLEAKVRLAPVAGFEVDPAALDHPWLKPHVRALVAWGLRGGRRAWFTRFGLHKSCMQLEAGRQVLRHVGVHARGLIVAPLGVRRDMRIDAEKLGIALTFVRTTAECAAPGLYLTNYESVREGKLDPAGFDFASLDEAAVLRGFGGSKTFREFMRLFEAVPYRFVATATPSPNDFIELLAYAAYLGVMDVGEAKTRFFHRDSQKADKLTLHPHKAREFWLWISSWAVFLQRPSDLGFSDEGYELPPLVVRWHEVKVDHAGAGEEKSGQGRMFRNASLGVVDAARERHATLVARVAKLTEILAADPDSPRILWHDLEDERRLIEASVPGAVAVYGSQDLDAREDIVGLFADGFLKHLAAKPVMLGAGTNLQRHCRKAAFVGVNAKFHDFIQAVHRLLRFGQAGTVEIDVIYAESEREQVQTLKRKWRQHDQQVEAMTEIIRQYGLNGLDAADVLARAMFDEDRERIEVCAPDGRWTMVLNDTVAETRRMPDASVDLIVTSIPFSTQYEYTPSYNDFGHSDSNDAFWEQMDFLAPELFRVLAPGRVAVIHVKDRIVPGGLTGLGFQTVYPFADDCRACFRRAGFAYLGEKTNLTDVVRENNQTYRLGHSEQLKDGSRMGAGLPEKLLLFRKPPSDLGDGYADTPVVKPRPAYVDEGGTVAAYDRKAEQAGKIRPVPGTGYSRGRWQVDAHHLARSSGDRLVKPEEWASFPAQRVFRLWKAINLTEIYDYEFHVAIGEALTFKGRLPPTFMLLPPHSWHDDVWTDVMQARGLNTVNAAEGREQHLCPLPFDIAKRAIVQFSMPGELVFDPFAGIGTVPYVALELGRCGRGHELNPGYFADAVNHCEAKARETGLPTLFDALGLRGDDPSPEDDLPEALRGAGPEERAA